MSDRKRDPHLQKKKGWYYLTFYDPNRQPRRKWVPLRTKQLRQAQRDEITLADQWRSGTYDPWAEGATSDQEATITEAVTRYVAHCRRRGVRSWKWKQAVMLRFAASLPVGTSPAAVTPSDVERFIYAPPMEHAHFRKSTHRRTYHTHRCYRTELKVFFGWCESERLVQQSPMDEVRKPKRRRRPVEYYTPEQLGRLLRAIESDYEIKAATGRLKNPHAPRQIIWLRDPILFLALTGLRPGELVGLRWRDVDMEGGTPVRITVRETEDRGVKTENAERPVPLVAQAAEIVSRLHAERPTESDDDPVFLSPEMSKGPRRISPKALSTGFAKYRALAKLPDSVTLYNMRTTCGVLLASRGVPLRIIQKIMGHANIKTTASTYTEIYDEAVRQEMERAMSLLSGK